MKSLEAESNRLFAGLAVVAVAACFSFAIAVARELLMERMWSSTVPVLDFEPYLRVLGALALAVTASLAVGTGIAARGAREALSRGALWTAFALHLSVLALSASSFAGALDGAPPFVDHLWASLSLAADVAFAVALFEIARTRSTFTQVLAVLFLLVSAAGTFAFTVVPRTVGTSTMFSALTFSDRTIFVVAVVTGLLTARGAKVPPAPLGVGSAAVGQIRGAILGSMGLSFVTAMAGRLFVSSPDVMLGIALLATLGDVVLAVVLLRAFATIGRDNALQTEALAAWVTLALRLAVGGGIALYSTSLLRAASEGSYSAASDLMHLAPWFMALPLVCGGLFQGALFALLGAAARVSRQDDVASDAHAGIGWVIATVTVGGFAIFVIATGPELILLVPLALGALACGITTLVTFLRVTGRLEVVTVGTHPELAPHSPAENVSG